MDMHTYLHIACLLSRLNIDIFFPYYFLSSLFLKFPGVLCAFNLMKKLNFGFRFYF